MRIKRTVRKTDGTLTIDGTRFELPNCYTHMDELSLRYARWDLGEAEIICPDTFKPLCTIHPVDKLANSNSIRKINQNQRAGNEADSLPDSEEILSLSTDTLPPLLARCLEKHAQENRLSGYLPLEKRTQLS